MGLHTEQLKLVASASVAGTPVEKIAEATNLSEEKIKSMVATPTKRFEALLAQARQNMQLGHVKIRMELADMVDDAVMAIRETVNQNDDRRLRYEAARDISSANGFIFSRDRPAAKMAPGDDHSNTVNIFTDGRAGQVVQEAFTSIRDGMDQLRDASPLPSVKNIPLSSHVRLSAADDLSDAVVVGGELSSQVEDDE